MSQNPLVAIHCITYNQERYIRDALEGFIRQQTDFPFVAIVHDDASTDNTAAIIKEYADKYPDIIKPIFETENQYSKKDGSLTRIMNKACEATGAKYIAFCEGDDYWLDEYKLNKQVSFLEDHDEFGMSVTACKRLYQENNIFHDMNVAGDLNFETLLIGNTIYTATVVVRSRLLYQYYASDVTQKLCNLKMEDYPIWLWMAWKSKVHYMTDRTTVYRVLSESASHVSFDKWLQFMSSAVDVKAYYSKLSNKMENEVKSEKLLFGILQAIDRKEIQSVRTYQKKVKEINISNLSGKFKIVNIMLCYFPRLIYYISKIRYKEENNPSIFYRFYLKLRSKKWL